MKHKDYMCPRCGYCTPFKNDMRKHMYRKLKVCPAALKDIEMTDEIKGYVLDNRVYRVPGEKEEAAACDDSVVIAELRELIEMYKHDATTKGILLDKIFSITQHHPRV